jgi:bacillithiol biosynthesis cysteine-adding enzyme BshC
MSTITLKNTIYKNKLLLDFLDHATNLSSFHNGSSLDMIDDHFMMDRDLQIYQRKILVNALVRQYDSIGEEAPSGVYQLEKKGVYSVTTGHQLCFMGGPQFFIHKIISTIKSCQLLKEKYPQNDFIPIFWMATEDHDFQEISHTTIFGKKFSLEDTMDSVAVGRLKSSLFRSLHEEVKEFFKTDEKFNILENLFEKAMSFESWSKTTRYWVHYLFKDHGLVILDADDKELKKSFKKIIEADINQQFVYRHVKETNQKLSDLHYKVQIDPRELNLFYHDTSKRERIKLEDDRFKIAELNYDQDSLLNLAESDIDRFSPNVLLRPLYQEHILPNLAYVGGPSELAYWIQLKSSFDHVGIPYPILILRDHFAFMSEKQLQKWIDNGFLKEQLLEDFDQLVKNMVKDEMNETGDFNPFYQQLDEMEKALSILVTKQDQSLRGSVGSSINSMKKALASTEGKFKKSIKRKNEQKTNQLLKIQKQVIQNNSLTERNESFISAFLTFEDYLKLLLDRSNPGSGVLTLLLNKK